MRDTLPYYGHLASFTVMLNSCACLLGAREMGRTLTLAVGAAPAVRSRGQFPLSQGDACPAWGWQLDERKIPEDRQNVASWGRSWKWG